MGSRRRVELLVESSEMARTLCAEGIARRRPECSEADRRIELFRLCWGDSVPSEGWAVIERRLRAGGASTGYVAASPDP